MLSRNDYMFKKIIIVFTNKGEKFRIQNDNLIVEDNNGEIILQSTGYRIFSLWIVGNYNITTPLINRAKKFGYSIFLFSHSFRIIESFCIPLEGNTLLRQRQFYNENNFDIAKHFVKNKIENQKYALRKSDLDNLILNNVNLKLDEYYNKIDSIEDDKSLLGIEGAASRLYFSTLFIGKDWKGRKPRVKHDINNCLMDLGYTLLFTYIEALLKCFGFDSYIGVYHKIFYKRKSLVCDMIEPFRPIIDYQIVKMNNLNMIDNNDFTIRNFQVTLNYKDSKKYVGCLMKAILDNREDLFMYVQNYYRAFMKNKNIVDFPVYKFR
ncbi:type V CRISPR-associated endonuclease Cas1 [Helcococcus kunzii]|uniref:type V CRISPR-associated endonuclease Cas1 n=1 Tax=Helcococcus kunzii TaxID=40091 RepID=UPI0021A4DE27|nr:type V CRISPR-associated endonuclease Cas1 [Helcococcus kunzii]MCT1795760.1 type V CRISPR-associated endonuclease Cas1 [Helcococcus kunzii]MCT1989559.1 type V CRISPR-associated endonuclease Cas1 [Helcococcus kunzii]